MTVKGEDKLALSLIDMLAGDDGLDVGTQLVMEGMAEREVWNVEEDVVEGYNGAVCKVVIKCPSRSKARISAKDLKLKMGDTVKSVADNNNKAVTETDVIVKSPFLHLLTVEEEI